ILLSSTQYIKKGPEYEMLKPWLNEGLLLSSGQKWHNRRKLLTNTFHFKTLGMYNLSINKHSRKLVDKLLKASTNGNKEISIFEYITLCSLDMICETIMGTEMNAQEGKSVEYVHSIKCACKLVIERVFKVWLWNDLIYRISKSGQRFFKSTKVLHEFTDNVIKNKRASLNKTIIEKVQSDSTFEKPQKKSFLDILLNVLDENPDQMNDKDIREEVDTFLFEGHDTSSISMTMTLVLLGIYQDVQDRARDELFDIFGDSERDATMEDLNSMQYLEAVIKESLRLYPSVPGFSRELEKPLSINNYTLPPKTTVIVYPYVLHRNEDIYPNAEEFMPERFLEEENKEKFHFGYLPFSAGARNCIGQKYAMNQMKTVISTILRNMKFKSLGNKDDIQLFSEVSTQSDRYTINFERLTSAIREMIELNVYSAVLMPLAGLILYAVWSRLRMPLEYRQISSHVPSVTKTFWSEMLFSWKLAMLKPKDILPFLTDLIRTIGPVVHFNLSGRSYVLLNDPDDLKILLSSTQYIKKGPEYDMLKPWLNEGLLLSSGQKWQNRRKLLTNTFHFKTLDMYNPSLNRHSRILIDKLLNASANGNREISIPEYITLCSLDMICETIMGTEMNAQEGKSTEYVHSIKSACKSVIERIFKFWLWNDLVYKMSESGQSFFKSIKVLHAFTDNVIKSKRPSLNNSGLEKVQSDSKFEKTKKKSFLDLLLNVLNDTPDQMNDKDIREEVDTFLFEGHDTTSIAMTMILVLLGMHSDIQKEARDEIRSIFEYSDRDATMEDLNAMKYLEAVIKESLRMYPSVPAFTRELEKPLQLKNYIIPPLTTITVYPFILHRNEDIYPNPEEFIPERFLEEKNKANFLFGYLPFSAGARNCIGQKYAMNQMKIVVSTILRNAKIETLGCKEDIKISSQLIIRIESLPKMKFYKL
ncbi:cytochrome P450 4C1-like, partial [Aphis craccivora]